MRHIETTSHGIQYFVFEHSKFYQKIQFEFLDAVESLNPQNIAVCTFFTVISLILLFCEWVNVSFGTSSPRLSRTKSREP